jgi:hypothetical protein
MDRALLNEHDANQGAQSRGEFLGMTGNSGWYLLGSIGASLLMVILCWGILGISLLLCLLVGVVLCGLSVAYVFTLKNNRPAHYDTDFFESALIEAGLIEMAFGPRSQRLPNPFTTDAIVEAKPRKAEAERRGSFTRKESQRSSPRRGEGGAANPAPATAETKRKVREISEPIVPLSAYEHVREELDLAEEMLEEALTDRLEG